MLMPMVTGKFLCDEIALVMTCNKKRKRKKLGFKSQRIIKNWIFYSKFLPSLAFSSSSSFIFFPKMFRLILVNNFIIWTE